MDLRRLCVLHMPGTPRPIRSHCVVIAASLLTLAAPPHFGCSRSLAQDGVFLIRTSTSSPDDYVISVSAMGSVQVLCMQDALGLYSLCQRPLRNVHSVPNTQKIIAVRVVLQHHMIKHKGGRMTSRSGKKLNGAASLDWVLVPCSPACSCDSTVTGALIVYPSARTCACTTGLRELVAHYKEESDGLPVLLTTGIDMVAFCYQRDNPSLYQVEDAACGRMCYGVV